MGNQTKHVHRLKKHKYVKTGNVIFFCTLPDCHFKIEAALSLGKRALCNICGEEFIMNEYTVKLTTPHCSNCGKIKIRDAEGKNRYIRKHQIAGALAEVADNSISDLRSRLEDAVAVEEDIV